jgi:hypothetical protein
MSAFADSIEAALTTYPLCQQIVTFLVQNESAMDSVEGIAKFWVGNDELAVKSALDCLVSVGVVVAQVLSSGAYYRLTPDPQIRGWLQTNRLHGMQSLRSVLGDADCQQHPPQMIE